jgi:hypothetical protein
VPASWLLSRICWTRGASSVRAKPAFFTLHGGRVIVARQQLGTATHRRTNSNTASPAGPVRQDLFGDRLGLVLRCVDDGFEKVRLGGESPVERSHTHIGPRRDLLHRRVVSQLCEHVPSRREDTGQVELRVPSQRSRVGS